MGDARRFVSASRERGAAERGRRDGAAPGSRALGAGRGRAGSRPRAPPRPGPALPLGRPSAAAAREARLPLCGAVTPAPRPGGRRRLSGGGRTQARGPRGLESANRPDAEAAGRSARPGAARPPLCPSPQPGGRGRCLPSEPSAPAGFLHPPSGAAPGPGTVLGAQRWSLGQGLGHREEGATNCTLMISVVRSRMVTLKVPSLPFFSVNLKKKKCPTNTLCLSCAGKKSGCLKRVRESPQGISGAGAAASGKGRVAPALGRPPTWTCRAMHSCALRHSSAGKLLPWEWGLGIGKEIF